MVKMSPMKQFYIFDAHDAGLGGRCQVSDEKWLCFNAYKLERMSNVKYSSASNNLVSTNQFNYYSALE